VLTFEFYIVTSFDQIEHNFVFNAVLWA